MLFRLIVYVSLLMLLTVPASGVVLSQLPDEAMTTAASRMKVKDYKGARDAALRAPVGGLRDFLLGMSAVKITDWETAADQLGKAATSLPLLGDFALYYQAYALFQLARYPESLTAVQSLVKNYPESPLARAAQKLLADSLYETGDFRDALAAYQRFIEKYPAGGDALASLHKLALCREQTGDVTGAAASLRNIWLNYPASPVAARAEEDLHRLADKGVWSAPFTAEELLRRGTVLCDLRKFDKAVAVFNAIPRESQPDEFILRLLLKTGQAQFKARRFRDAEQTFTTLLTKNPKRDIGAEARFWLAKCLDKKGRDEEAFTAFGGVAEAFPDSALADDALLEAAFIRKFQNRTGEELTVLKKLLSMYPRSNLAQTAVWEIAWGSYRSGDMKTAAEYFRKQFDNERTRERALYWYGRTLAAAGDEKGAQDSFTTLTTEFPLGYYALTYKKETGTTDGEAAALTGNMCDILPLPAGFERAKTLIALGLYEEANKELTAYKKKSSGKAKALYGLARLYLEMGDYSGAFSLVKEARPRNMEKESLLTWGLAYPLAYRELVAQNAAKCAIDDCLVFSIIRAESNYSPTALSPVGAVGLMQLMPATASAIARNGTGSLPAPLTQPELNIRYGVKHLKDLLVLFNGDIVKAVAAYNAGSGNVSRWVSRLGNMPAAEFIENIPYAETREYVKKVLTGAEIYNRLYKLGNREERKPSSVSPPQKGSVPSLPSQS